MKIASISDIHIKTQGDLGHQALNSFFSAVATKQADAVIYLGDIFDTLIGYNPNFIKKYDFFFYQINELLNQGKSVYFINGNHDFHLNRLFEEAINSKNRHLFNYCEKGVTLLSNNTKLFFSHGDDEEIENDTHKKFKMFINWKVSKWIASKWYLTGALDKMATVLSDLSRQSNGKYHINDPIITKKFRQTAEQLYKAEKFDIWVAGHSHCEDNYHSENGFKYFNNGFVQNTKKFFYFDGQQGSLEKLFSSMGKF